MVGLAYASVPLYDLFCRVTGFDGTPLVRTRPAGEVLDRAIAVRFDANVAPGLTWRFAPETPEVKVKLGETTTVLYRVTNEGPAPPPGSRPSTSSRPSPAPTSSSSNASASPSRRCSRARRRDSAVVFYVDPGLRGRSERHGTSRASTLSYTYFPAQGGQPVAQRCDIGPNATTP